RAARRESATPQLSSFRCARDGHSCSSDITLRANARGDAAGRLDCLRPGLRRAWEVARERRAMTDASAPNGAPGTAVIALGGNALAPSGERSNVYDQFRHTRASLGPIVDLVSAGWNVCVVHG